MKTLRRLWLKAVRTGRTAEVREIQAEAWPNPVGRIRIDEREEAEGPDVDTGPPPVRYARAAKAPYLASITVEAHACVEGGTDDANNRSRDEERLRDEERAVKLTGDLAAQIDAPQTAAVLAAELRNCDENGTWDYARAALTSMCEMLEAAVNEAGPGTEGGGDDDGPEGNDCLHEAPDAGEIPPRVRRILARETKRFRSARKACGGKLPVYVSIAGGAEGEPQTAETAGDTARP